MKFFEVMKTVWKTDTSWLAERLAKWLTLRNILQGLALASGIFIVVLAWIPVNWIYFVKMPKNPLMLELWIRGGGFWTILLLFCFAFAVLWTVFWVRVFDKWWPF